MRVRLVRRPGQHGTKAYVDQHGDKLVCVRYRYDEALKKRYKTIEIIVDEQPWEPKAKEGEKESSTQAPQIAPDTLVGIRLVWGEVEIARQLRSAGAGWRYDLKMWQTPYATAVSLGLANRIVGTIDELTGASERPL